MSKSKSEVEEENNIIQCVLWHSSYFSLTTTGFLTIKLSLCWENRTIAQFATVSL